MSNRWSLVVLCAITYACAGSFGIALAQPYPNKPIKLIIPYPPAGGPDVILRLMAPVVGDKLRQPVVIENRSGADSSIGLALVARAAPDGYTIGLAAQDLSANEVLQADRGFSVKDLQGVIGLAQGPNVLIVPPTFTANTLAGFVEYARKNPGQVFIGSGGAVQMLMTTSLAHAAKLDINPIPYRGQAIMDVVSGRLSKSWSGLAPAMPLIRAGRVVPIAVTSGKRHSMLPDVPSISELFPGIEYYTWYGIVVPAATPPDIVERLHAGFAAALQDAQVLKNLTDRGLDIDASTPAQFHARVLDETEKFRQCCSPAKK